MKRNVLLSFVLAFFVLILYGCGFFSTTSTTPILSTTIPTSVTTEPVSTTTYSTDSDLTIRLKQIYDLALDSESFEGTYEEWLETVKGPQGLDGREVLLQVADGYIQWQHVGDNTWENLVEVITLVGEAGEQGVGISSMEINDLGELIVTLTDDTNLNLGQILKVYIVVFKDYNGYVLDVQLVFYNHDGVAPDSPSREGYTFVGWNTTFNNITTDLTIYAEYSINTYSVTFDSNSGSAVAGLSDIEYGSQIPLEIPIKEGFFFDGWYLGNNINDPQFTSKDQVTSDLTLYARWNLAAYNVTFVDYDDTVLFKQLVNYGYSASSPSNPTRSGYIFLSWDTAFNAVTSDITVTALYTPIDYTISFETNGGTLVSDYVAGFETALPSFDIPILTGYTFFDWYRDIECTELFTETTMPGENITVYAKWVVEESDFTFFLLEDDTYEITGYTGTDTDLVFPSTYLGVSVTSIGDNAFSDCHYVTSIIIPEGVTRIGSYSFENCNNMTTISLPYGLYYIGPFSFSNCYSLTEVILPETLTLMGYYAFFNCTSLTNVYLPSSNTIIYQYTFSGCTSLTSIMIPIEVIRIDESVFQNCVNLTILVETSSKPEDWDLNWNPDSRPVIWGYLEKSLATINFDSNGGSYVTPIIQEVGSLITEPTNPTKEGYEFNGWYTDVALSIPYSFITMPEEDITLYAKWVVEEIDFTFFLLEDDTYEITGYTGEDAIIVIPSEYLGVAVTSIGEDAFNFSNYTSVSISEGITIIRAGAFANCLTLESVTLPSTLIKIEFQVFANCTALIEIIIPSSVTIMEMYVFNYDFSTIINCEALSIPEGWDLYWNYNGATTVNWGYTG